MNITTVLTSWQIVRRVFSWIFGIIFVLLGLLFPILSTLSGFLLVTGGLMLLPPVHKWMRAKSGLFRAFVTVPLAIILFFVSVSAMPHQAPAPKTSGVAGISEKKSDPQTTDDSAKAAEEAAVRQKAEEEERRQDEAEAKAKADLAAQELAKQEADKKAQEEAAKQSSLAAAASTQVQTTTSKTSNSTSTQTTSVTATSVVIKKSKTNICHAPGTQYYDQTKYFTPYNTIEGCIASGGRLPK